jgi:GNAT superfamily N-acetyltransferase
VRCAAHRIVSGDGATPELVHAWLAARSVARGLPPPVPDHGGFRVDTNLEQEAKRWVFPGIGPGLVDLLRSIDLPRHVVKLCGTTEQLQSLLPAGWRMHPPASFMRSEGVSIAAALPTGYAIDTERRDAVIEVRILSAEGDLAASGYAAETQDAFIYDRIVTDPAHRRKGLGRAVMAALGRAKRRSTPELLVATQDGQALYSALGWRVVSPYVTASIAEGAD